MRSFLYIFAIKFFWLQMLFCSHWYVGMKIGKNFSKNTFQAAGQERLAADGAPLSPYSYKLNVANNQTIFSFLGGYEKRFYNRLSGYVEISGDIFMGGRKGGVFPKTNNTYTAYNINSYLKNIFFLSVSPGLIFKKSTNLSYYLGARIGVKQCDMRFFQLDASGNVISANTSNIKPYLLNYSPIVFAASYAVSSKIIIRPSVEVSISPGKVILKNLQNGAGFMSRKATCAINFESITPIATIDLIYKI